MDVSVDVRGLPELVARLEHARAGVLDLSTQLALELEQELPPMKVHESVRMRARQWGPGDVWTLPAGGWIAPRVKLPDPADQLTQTVQQLLD